MFLGQTVEANMFGPLGSRWPFVHKVFGIGCTGNEDVGAFAFDDIP
jgi:hypothetical protein